MDKYDLFRVLKKSSFEEVSRAWASVPIQVSPGTYVTSEDALQAALDAHGWTSDEFLAERKLRHALHMLELAEKITDTIAKDIDKEVARPFYAIATK